jgi:hypothetical protein
VAIILEVEVNVTKVGYRVGEELACKYGCLSRVAYSCRRLVITTLSKRWKG